MGAKVVPALIGFKISITKAKQMTVHYHMRIDVNFIPSTRNVPPDILPVSVYEEELSRLDEISYHAGTGRINI